MRARRARRTVAGGGRMGASPQGLGCTWTWRGSVYVQPGPAPRLARRQGPPRPRSQPPSPSLGPTSSTFRRPQTV